MVDAPSRINTPTLHSANEVFRMSAHKEFEGKNLDEAIREACGYYGVEREKLEIEILNDSTSGIFGLVGVKKARIRASRATPLPSSLLDDIDAPMDVLMAESSGPGNSLEEPAPKRRRDAAGHKKSFPGDMPEAVGEGRGRPRRPKKAESPYQPDVDGNRVLPAPDAGRRRGRPEKDSGNGKREERNGSRKGEDREEARRRSGERRNADNRPRNRTVSGKEADRSEEKCLSPEHAQRDELPDLSLATCDKEHVGAVVRDVVARLASSIVGDVPCAVTVTDERVTAVLSCGDDSGLLVGRDGQTLAAVQYLAGRMVARILGGSLRLQVDAGNYRERQDDRLKELGLALAAKVKDSGRSQSTRPLSAYQRRIIHLTLENDPQVQTVSKGEGSQRRVIIQLRRQPRDGAEEE